MLQNLQGLQKMTEKSSITYKQFYEWATVGYLEEKSIQRSRERIVQNNEVFTSLDYVLIGLDFYPKERFLDSSISFCDGCAGEGVWLVGFALKRMEYGMPHNEAVKNLKAVELMSDNREAIISRLMCKDQSLKTVLETNIVCHDALTYDYSFNGTNKNKSELLFENLFEEQE